MLGKKSTGKSAKQRFSDTHDYRDLKELEKNGRNNFSGNTRIVGKKCLEKNRR